MSKGIHVLKKLMKRLVKTKKHSAFVTLKDVIVARATHAPEHAVLNQSCLRVSFDRRMPISDLGAALQFISLASRRRLWISGRRLEKKRNLRKTIRLCLKAIDREKWRSLLSRNG